MCIEHKYYRKCCLAIDITYIDRCPLADRGQRCTIEERIHPVEGYCPACRRARNKVEDDVTTSPLYTRNDNYQRPWEAPRYKPVKSRPLAIPLSNYGQPSPERGRTLRRTPPPALPELVQVPNFNNHFKDRPHTPMQSDDEETERLRRYHRRKAKGYHDSFEYRESTHYKNDYPRIKQHFHPAPMQYRVASPKTIYKLQKNGMLPPLQRLHSMCI